MDFDGTAVASANRVAVAVDDLLAQRDPFRGEVGEDGRLSGGSDFGDVHFNFRAEPSKAALLYQAVCLPTNHQDVARKAL